MLSYLPGVIQGCDAAQEGPPVMVRVNGQWREATEAEIAAANAASLVPRSVTKRQLYRGLMQVQWLGTTQPQIDAAISGLIATMPEPPREVARVEFFTSRDYLRNNALLLGALMAPPLSKTVAEIDDFFRLCGSFAPE